MTFQGIHAALVTPFTASGEVDTASLERLARHCLENGADGLVALGTTGEAATLTPDERRTGAGDVPRRVGRARSAADRRRRDDGHRQGRPVRGRRVHLPMLQLGASGGVAACACLAPGAYAANPGCARRCGRTPDRSARPWPPTAPCPRF
ncbi:dihydrodipicolinate synthase family protein [Actinomadura hallensis]|uniref:dihydrodipicolinate synthase family protein n=1 Tax=Actinomadura hallensis TaxID=337895 RepID=UPI0011503815|nr:dihydrodipicolinate synthase family protein [Actinomadura hallensis]